MEALMNIAIENTKDIAMSIQAEADAKILTARTDFQKGMIDCQNGIYDKWYRYHRQDDGIAYDKGWMFQNETTQNEEVNFLSCN